MSDSEIRKPLFAAAQVVSFPEEAASTAVDNAAVLETLINVTEALLMVLHNARGSDALGGR
ncbi:hypothetical protein [Allokutzneria oryzae]|uniref:Uncharacterized protein n=1 Tax=Allokutzneria oryzae TaxID=1378989 RepID=A0ABV5ZZK3_9PSEU